MRRTIALPLLADIQFTDSRPKYDRRLTDKVLAAFTHAYEANEHEIAAILRRALEAAERAARDAGLPRRENATHQADLWVEFVDARKAYNQACAREPIDMDALEEARLDMLEAYRRWSAA